MDYKHKYLKYKHKYLSLKLLQKGSAICHSNPNIQHYNECWSDSIQTIFMYSDPINNIIQEKLTKFIKTDEYVDITTIDKFNKYTEKNNKKIKENIKNFINDVIKRKHNNYLPINFDFDIEEDKNEFVKYAIELVYNLCIRFNRREIYEKNLEVPISRLTSIDTETLLCVSLFFDFINYKRINKKIFDKFNHMGNVFDNMYFILLLSYLFTTDYIIDYEFYLTDHSVDRDNYVKIPDEQKTPNEIKNLTQIPTYISQNTIGILLLSFSKYSSSGHETAVITCNDTNKWYNNYNPLYETEQKFTLENYDWKNIFMKPDTVLKNIKFNATQSSVLSLDGVGDDYEFLYLRYIVPLFKNNNIDLDFKNLELDKTNILINEKLRNYIDNKIDFFRYIILLYNLSPKYSNLYKYILRNKKNSHSTRVLFPLKVIYGGFVNNTLLLYIFKFILKNNDIELFNYILSNNEDYIKDVIKKINEKDVISNYKW